MAAPVNLPVSSKAAPTPSVEKVSAGDSGSANGAGQNGFSQVLHQQLDKHQTSTASGPNKSAAKPGNSQSKQSVSNSASAPQQAAEQPKTSTKPEPQQQAKAQTSDPAQQAEKAQAMDSSQQQDQAKAESSDAAMAAAMQTQAPMTPMSQLRELVAASLHGNGQNGNALPLEAANTAANGAGASGQGDLMKLLALRTAAAGTAAQQGQSSGNNSTAAQGMAGLPQQLQLLEQRLQKQIALEQSSQTSNGTNTQDSGSTHLDVKQLQGLENALQSLAKANSQGDGKGLATAWTQLNDRLQQLQLSQDASGSNSDSTDGLTGMLKTLQQEMASVQQSAHLQAGQSDKAMRLVFQEMLNKLGAQQRLDKPAPQLTNNSTLANASVNGANVGATQSQSQQAAPGSPLPTTTVNVPVHNQAWGQAMGERLQWMVKQDMKHAEIKLNPRHLGPIEVKIAMNQDQATVSFSAHHAVTKEALEAAMPKLRDMFGANGINLLDVNVSHHSGSEGQQANANSQQGQSGSGHSGAWSPFDSSAHEPLLATDVRTPQWFGSNRMLDTYV